MKKFILKITSFIPLIILVFYLDPFYLIITESYKNDIAGKEIYYSIKKSTELSDAEILLLGDSVARQLLNNEENDLLINSLACNQGISLVGQFILLEKYLKKGNKIDKLIILYHPISFKNNLDQIYTFHYFMKPFYIKENYKYFSPTVFNQISKIPFYYLNREPFILTSNWSPKYSSPIDEFGNTKKGSFWLSKVSIEYLKKIQQLAEVNDFKIQLVAPPISAAKQELIKAMNTDLIKGNELEGMFKDYFENIIYCDDSFFKDDIHLNLKGLKRFNKNKNLLNIND